MDTPVRLNGKVPERLPQLAAFTLSATGRFSLFGDTSLFSAFMMACNAALTFGCRLVGTASNTFAILCTLCRRRHKVHYADLRIMPTWGLARTDSGLKRSA